MHPRHQTYGTCRFGGCTDQATEVIVTVREGFCFERCATHARLCVDWMSR